jgi:hypothetical protein
MTAEPQDVPPEQPLRSKHTSNLPRLLEQLGISVLVTTYQAGKLMGTLHATYCNDASTLVR